MEDAIKVTGSVVITLTSPDGTVEVEEVSNLVVDVGREFVAARMLASPPAAIGWIAIGSGTSAPEGGNTELQNELYRGPATANNVENKVQYAFSAGPGDGTGVITEAALLNSASVGVMLSRVVFPAKTKSADKTLGMVWTISFN